MTGKTALLPCRWLSLGCLSWAAWHGWNRHLWNHAGGKAKEASCTVQSWHGTASRQANRGTVAAWRTGNDPHMMNERVEVRSSHTHRHTTEASLSKGTVLRLINDLSSNRRKDRPLPPYSCPTPSLKVKWVTGPETSGLLRCSNVRCYTCYKHIRIASKQCRNCTK